jgi:hypothetical protein
MTTHIVTSADAKDTDATGRIATFTFGDARPAAIRAALDEIGIDGRRYGPEDPGADVVFREACEALPFRWNQTHGKQSPTRVFVRAVQGGAVDIFHETLAPGGGAERVIVGRATSAGLVYCFDQDVADTWQAVHTYHAEHMAARAVGRWGELFVLQHFQALELPNRGHSVHIRAGKARLFDAWLAAMRRACTVQAVSFATMDTDPESLASLIAAIREKVERTIESETIAIGKAKTERGRAGCLDRLRDCKRLLAGYKALAADEVGLMSAALEEAECAFAVAVLTT